MSPTISPLIPGTRPDAKWSPARTAQILSSTDPITGREIDDLTGHPYLVNGNVTMYFESEATRQEFIDMSADHPLHLADNPTGEGYAEG